MKFGRILIDRIFVIFPSIGSKKYWKIIQVTAGNVVSLKICRAIKLLKFPITNPLDLSRNMEMLFLNEEEHCLSIYPMRPRTADSLVQWRRGGILIYRIFQAQFQGRAIGLMSSTRPSRGNGVCTWIRMCFLKPNLLAYE